MMSRRLFAALWIALGLLLGQQAAALHDLAHATEQLGSDKKPGTPSKHVCDECFFSAQLSGAVGSHVAIPPVVLGADATVSLRRDDVELPTPRLQFRSQAPPTVL